MNVKRFKFNFAIITILFGLTGMVRAESLRDYVEQGNRLYHDEDFNKALAQYEKVPPETAEDPVVLYNRANCYYKLEDYTQAIKLFQDASIKSKNMQLVAQAKYNLGNCHYQQSIKQLDSNLQKAWEELDESVRYYREALDINPDDEDAIDNIAIIRLMMKDLLDRIKKEQEKQQQQRQQQDLAQKIKGLLQRQVGLLQQTAQALEKMSDPNRPDPQAGELLADQANDQLQLKDDTVSAADEAQQMTSQLGAQQAAQNTPGAVADPNTVMQMQQQKQIMETVAGQLNRAVEHQDGAATHLSEIQAEPALQEQTRAAESLQRALEAFGPQPPQPQQQSSQQDEQNQQNQQDQQQQQDQQPQQQPQPAVAPDTTARDILDEERQRRENQRRGVQSGYKTVDKDW